MTMVHTTHQQKGGDESEPFCSPIVEIKKAMAMVPLSQLMHCHFPSLQTKENKRGAKQH